MAVNEQIVTGRKFRKLVDEATKLWQRISFWTKASDVEFDDGLTAETKMGAINGITDSLVNTSSNIAASAKALSTLNNDLKGFKPILDSTGRITGYKTQAGADTVFPFSGGNIEYFAWKQAVGIYYPSKLTISIKNVRRGRYYLYVVQHYLEQGGIITNWGTEPQIDNANIISKINTGISASDTAKLPIWIFEIDVPSDSDVNVSLYTSFASTYGQFNLTAWLM